MRSGQVIWCNVCGSFGTFRGLAQSCPGPVTKDSEGGRAHQLRRLRAGFDPKDRHKLGPAIPQRERPHEEMQLITSIVGLQRVPEAEVSTEAGRVDS